MLLIFFAFSRRECCPERRCSNKSSQLVTMNETSNVTKTVAGFDIAYHPALIIIAVLVVISNTFVILLFVTKETLRKGGKLLLLSLALSDFTTGLVTIPINIGCEVTFALTTCVFSGMLNRFLAISTIYHILAITFEAYYAILRPMEHRVKIEQQKVLGIASAIWLGALIIAVIPLSWAIGELTDVENLPSEDFHYKMSIYEIFVFSFGFLLPLMLLIFAHARMFSRIVSALRLIRRQNSPPPKSHSMNKNKYKAAVLFAMLLLIFVMCWLLWFVVSISQAIDPHAKHPFPQLAVDIVVIIRYCTSFINPLLYTFFRPDFYKAFRSLFRKNTQRTPSITLTYLLSGSHRNKRDSQTTTTILVREHSIAGRNCSVTAKMIEEDCEV